MEKNTIWAIVLSTIVVIASFLLQPIIFGPQIEAAMQQQEIAAQERRIKRLEEKQSVIQYGVIAQEVEDIFPECISIDNNGYYSVDYDKFGLYAIEGIKALHQKVKDLEVQNEELQTKNEELELRLAIIEAKLGL